MSSKPRILCLHGYSQNDMSFRRQLTPLVDRLGAQFDFDFICGPVEVPLESAKAVWEKYNFMSEGQLPRLFFSKPGSLRAWFRADGVQWHGWQASRRLLLDSLEDCQPVVIIGYSQGFQAVMRLLGELNRGEISSPAMQDCRCLVALASPHTKWFVDTMVETRFSTPSIHAYGLQCPFIADYEALLRCFETPEIVTYDGGHFTPTEDGPFWEKVAGFIARFVD